MRTKILPYFVVFWASTAFLRASTNVVAPGGLANVEGNSSIAEPFNSTSFRFQQVFDASQFGVAAGATARIDSISFRIDGASTNNVILFFGGGTAVLSTTQKSPDGLSATFADNRGNNTVTIFSGAFSFAGDPEPGGPPYSFNETIQATTPYFYVPSQGNLLLDLIGGSGQPFLPGAMDAQSLQGDSVSRVFANSFGAATGTADTLGLVTEFQITVVPEPRPLSMIVALAVVLGILTKHRSGKSPRSKRVGTRNENLRFR